MPELGDTQYAAIASVLSAYDREFDRAEDTWKSLETKAQGTITIAGIFIGFALNFAKDIPSSSAFGIRLALTITLILLGGAVILAGSALKIRVLSAGPGGKHLETILDDLYAVPERERSSYLPLIYQTRIKALAESVGDRQKKNEEKAKDILRAQKALAAAVTCAAGLAIALAWVKRPASLDGVTKHEVHQVWMQQRGGGWCLLLKPSPGSANNEKSRGDEGAGPKSKPQGC